MSSMFMPQYHSIQSAQPASPLQSGARPSGGVIKRRFRWPDKHKDILFYLMQEQQKQEYVKLKSGEAIMNQWTFFDVIVNQLRSCGVRKQDGNFRDEPSCRSMWELSSYMDYKKTGWVPTTYHHPLGIPFHVVNATGADLPRLMSISAGIAIKSGQQIFTKEMQKTRIDNIRQGRENVNGDGDLILMAASVQIRSLPFYNGTASAPVKQYRKKNRYHQGTVSQTNRTVPSQAGNITMAVSLADLTAQGQPQPHLYSNNMATTADIEDPNDPFDIDQTNAKNDAFQYHIAQIDKFETLIKDLEKKAGNTAEIELLRAWIEIEETILATLD